MGSKMKKVKCLFLFIGVTLAMVALVACQSAPTPKPAPAPSPAQTVAPKPSPTAAPAAKPSPTVAAKPSPAAKPATKPAAKPAPITIGITEDLSGFSRDAGNAKMEAAIMAIEEWNAKGGVSGGAEVKYVSRDNAGDPAKATTIAREFVSMGVVAVIGGTSSTVAIPESKVLTPAKIPLMVGAAAVEIFDKGPDGKSYAFTSSGSNPVMVENVLLDMAKRGYKKFVNVYSNVAWPKDMVAIYKDRVAKQFGPQNGMEIVGDFPVDVNATDLSAEVIKIKNLKFDVINGIFYPGTVNAWVRALASTGWRPAPKVYMLWDLAQTTWNTAEKSLFANVRAYSRSNYTKPEVVKKMGQYMTRWGREPRSGNWVMAYDEAAFLLRAIDAVGPKPAEIRDYLETKSKGLPTLAGSKDAVSDLTMDTLHSFNSAKDNHAYLNIDEKGQLAWE